MSLRALFVFAALFLVSAEVGAAAEPSRHVVVISIDGFPANLWRRPDLPAPNLRRLASTGAAADAMTVANPSLTWPNHTTLVTGVAPRRHGVLFNGLLVRHEGEPPTVDPGADKTKLVHAPTIYDLAHAAGLTTAESNWVAVLRAPTITWSFPEFPPADGAFVKEMIAAGVLTPAQVGAMQYGQQTSLPWHDEIWLNAATFAVTRHRPNLLLYHILTTDSVHHTYGPGTVASFTAIAYADRLVGELIRAVEGAGILADTTFVVVTDHGFKKVGQFSYPNVALKKAGLLQVAGPRIASGEAFVKGGGGVAMVFVADPKRRAELKPRLKEILTQCEGIAEVIDGDDATSLGFPTPAENDGMGDLVLYPKEGFSLSDSAAGDVTSGPTKNYSGTHGFKASDPELDGICVFSGRGIRSGTVLPRVSNLDVAPTIARLLGLEMPGVDGRVLDEILVEKGPE